MTVPFPFAPQVAFLDWDGTFCDSRPSIYAINLVMTKRYGVVMPQYDDWLTQAHPGPVELMRALGVPYSLSDESILDFLRDLLDAENEAGTKKPLYPGARKVLAGFRTLKIPAVLVSRHPHDHLVRDIENHGLSKFFAQVIGEPRDCALKKDEVIQAYCRTFSVAPSDTFYLGDTSHDMRLANLAGACSVGVSHGYDPPQELRKENPAHIFASLEDFLQFLKRR